MARFFQVLALCLAPSLAVAQAVQVLYGFEPSPAFPNGRRRGCPMARRAAASLAASTAWRARRSGAALASPLP